MCWPWKNVRSSPAFLALLNSLSWRRSPLPLTCAGVPALSPCRYSFLCIVMQNARIISNIVFDPGALWKHGPREIRMRTGVSFHSSSPPNSSEKEVCRHTFCHEESFRRQQSLSPKGFETLSLKGLYSLRTKGYDALMCSLKHYYRPSF